MPKKTDILDILRRIEEYRRDIDIGKQQPGCTNHTIQVCQAIVAEAGGYGTRNEWMEELFPSPRPVPSGKPAEGIITLEKWNESRLDFHTLVSGKAYPDNYPYTLYKNLPAPVEIDEDLYWHFMETLPPFFLDKNVFQGFQVSEDVYGGTYDTFTKQGNRYFYHGHGPKWAEWLTKKKEDI